MKLPVVTDLNGRVYPLRILEIMQDQINTDPRGIPGLFPPPPDFQIKMRDMAFQVSPTATIDSDILTIDIEILDTPSGQLLSKFMLNDNYVLVPNGIGSLSGNVVQDDYQLASFTVTERVRPAQILTETVATYLPHIRAPQTFVDAIRKITKKIVDDRS